MFLRYLKFLCFSLRKYFQFSLLFLLLITNLFSLFLFSSVFNNLCRKILLKYLSTILCKIVTKKKINDDKLISGDTIFFLITSRKLIA